MSKNSQTTGRLAEFHAVIRKRNQLTLPSEAADLLGICEGDIIVFEIEGGVATLRPVRRSYCGIGAGVYGDANEFVARERAGWQ